jgi:CelD/BcsL family acetyltransferase involved in cellulose biosynthesis
MEEIPDDPELRRAWNQLVLKMERPQVFYTYEWSMAVARAYSASLHPLLCLAYDEAESLCGVVALAKELGGSRTSFLCATTGDYCDFLSLPENKVPFIAAVLAELRRRNLGAVTLTNLPADSNTVDALQRASSQNGYHCFARTAYICAQVSLSDVEGGPGKNKVVLPGRKNLRRALSAMGRDAPVRLDHARSWEEIGPILPQFAHAHVARFLATGRISNLVRPERRVFLEQLAKLLSESGWIALTRMMSGNNSLAWNYGFQFQGTWFWYQPTFDSDWERYSPGFCLLAKVIQEAAENPALRVVDLGLGAEEYKDRFANQTRETLYLTLRASKVQHVSEELRYRTAKVLKTSARAEAGGRWITGWVRELRERARSEGLASALRQMGTPVTKSLWSEEEIVFFEWTGSVLAGSDRGRVEKLDLNRLASAALQSFDEKLTLGYLVRAAARLRAENAEGFGFADSDGLFVGFAWVGAFDSVFFQELGAKIEAPPEDGVLLFDCWTPRRGCGDAALGQLSGLIAEGMREKGKKTWTFSAASNTSLIQRLEGVGFQARYSLVRRQVLGWHKIKPKTSNDDGVRAGETAART